MTTMFQLQLFTACKPFDWIDTRIRISIQNWKLVWDETTGFPIQLRLPVWTTETLDEFSSYSQETVLSWQILNDSFFSLTLHNGT